jgi:hypothetical protein
MAGPEVWRGRLETLQAQMPFCTYMIMASFVGGAT